MSAIDKRHSLCIWMSDFKVRLYEVLLCSRSAKHYCAECDTIVLSKIFSKYENNVLFCKNSKQNYEEILYNL